MAAAILTLFILPLINKPQARSMLSALFLVMLLVLPGSLSSPWMAWWSTRFLSFLISCQLSTFLFFFYFYVLAPLIIFLEFFFWNPSLLKEPK